MHHCAKIVKKIKLVGIKPGNGILDSVSSAKSKRFVICARQIRQVGITRKKIITIFVICVMNLKKRSLILT